MRLPYPYLAYWYWDLRPASGGIGKFDLNDRLCPHFLLSIEDGNHDVPEHLALLVRNLCRMVRKRLERAGSALCSSSRGPFPSCGQSTTRPIR